MLLALPSDRPAQCLTARRALRAEAGGRCEGAARHRRHPGAQARGRAGGVCRQATGLRRPPQILRRNHLRRPQEPHGQRGHHGRWRAQSDPCDDSVATGEPTACGGPTAFGEGAACGGPIICATPNGVRRHHGLLRPQGLAPATPTRRSAPAEGSTPTEGTRPRDPPPHDLAPARRPAAMPPRHGGNPEHRKYTNPQNREYTPETGAAKPGKSATPR